MAVSEPNDAVASFVYMGYAVSVAHVPFDEQAHHSLLERLLAAGSAWGIPDDLWQWDVSCGGASVASDKELSETAAVEGAREWVRTHPLVP